MTATGHAVIGTVIASQIGDPLLAIPIAIASHFAADLFPHWDTATHWKTKGKSKLYRDTFLDCLLALALIYLLSHYIFPATGFFYASLISFFALLPDILTSPYLFFGIDKPPFIWVYRAQKLFDNRMDKPWGIIGQTAFLVALVGFFKLIG